MFKYAATYLLKLVSPCNAQTYIDYLLQIAFHNASILPLVAEVLGDYEVEISIKTIKKLLRVHLTYRRTDVVCWLLLILHLAGGRAPKSIAKQIISMGDCMPMVLMAAAGDHQGKIDKYLLNVDETRNYEMDQCWLLIYERAAENPRIQNRFKSYLGETGLTFLRSKNVKFTRKKPLIYVGAS